MTGAADPSTGREVEPARAVLRTLILACTTVLTVSGCVGLVMDAAPPSRYSPPWLSETRLANYFETVASLDRKPAQDELGLYYHRTAGERVHVTFLSQDDRDALRRLLADQIGLLEPVYRFDARGLGTVDWAATERRHAAFTAKGRLRLAPLTTTRLYAAAVERFAAAEGTRHSNSSLLSQISAARAGETTLYNSRFEAAVLASLPGPVHFVIVDSMTTHFVSQVQGGAPSGPGLALESLRQNMGYHVVTQFLPRSYLANIREGAIMRAHSACSLIDKPAALGFARWVRAPSAQPGGDFVRTMQRVDEMRQQNDDLCWAGLTEMGVTGAIQSEPLR